jgi:hypothetical protein
MVRLLASPAGAECPVTRDAERAPQPPHGLPRGPRGDADLTAVMVPPGREREHCYPNQGGSMSDPSAPETAPADEVPLGQRLFDRPLLLLAAGLLVMFLFYTGWGLWDVAQLPMGTLP